MIENVFRAEPQLRIGLKHVVDQIANGLTDAILKYQFKVLVDYSVDSGEILTQ